MTAAISSWTLADIPDQTGRCLIVTGANSGLGFHTTLELARRGAEVHISRHPVATESPCPKPESCAAPRQS